MPFPEEPRPAIADAPTAAQLDACRQYLSERAIRSDFFMVQIGHGGTPVAYQQPAWQGERRFFGVEAWLRDQDNERRKHLQQLVDGQPPNPNIQFLDLDLGGKLQRDEGQAEQEVTEAWYVGAYDPSVPLPDGVADEVFLGDVIGDSHAADSTDRTPLLLAEASRLLRPDGQVVIRETISPKRALASLTDEVLESVGLQSVLRLHWGNKLWPQLEELYDGRTTTWFPKRENFYQFLAKTTSP